MKKTLLFCTISMLAVFASCQREERSPLSESPEAPSVSARISTDFRAVLPGSSSKTAWDASTGIITWLTDDPVYVSNGSASMSLFVEEGGSSESALYSQEEVLEGTDFYAVYPFENAGFADQIFHSFIPSRQSYVKNGFATQTFPMVAVCDNHRRFAFKNAASLLRIETHSALTEGVRVASVTLLADQPMSGPISVDYAPGKNPEVTCEDGESAVTVVGPEEGIPFGETINVVVAPGNYGSPANFRV